MSIKIVVASQNPVKLQAARRGFMRLFPDAPLDVQGVAAPSQVSDQPASDEETRRGAHNRAINAAALLPNADYWVGIEGGIQLEREAMQAFAWVVVLAKDQRTGKGKTGTFYLPRQVANLVRQGKELGEADDIVFGRANSKQDNGAIGILSGNVIDRAAFYEHAVIMALLPFKNTHLTFD